MKRTLVFILLCLVYAPSLLGDSTPNVPMEDSVYRDVDKLIAAGLVKDTLYGQRPWSRREIGRIVGESWKRHESCESPYVTQILTRLRKKYHQELVDLGYVEGEKKGFRLTPLEQIRFDDTLLDSPFRPVPVTNNLGQIDAVINPLVENQEGRHFVDGNTLGLETIHQAQLSQYFSLYVRPRLEILVPNTGSSQVNPVVQQLYGKAAYRNFEIEVGRDSLVWGQGESGGLILSNNARPLDMVKLGTGSPFLLPSILQYLGPNSFKIFFAELGPERDHPHAILTGYKWSIKPTGFFELGLNHVVIMGGDGAQDPGFWEAIGEFSGLLSAVTSNKRQVDGGALTNRLFSLEGRLTLPFLRNSLLYGEVGFDDSNKRPKILFEDDGMYDVGIYIPRLADDGSADLRLEYKHIPAVSYRHSVYYSGFVLNRKILGDELGPDSDGVSVRFNKDIHESFLFSSAIAYERRDSDLFEARTEGFDTVEIAQIQNNPAEHRYRLENGVSWRPRSKPGLLVQARIGYERVLNFNFLQGVGMDNFIGQVVFAFEPPIFQ